MALTKVSNTMLVQPVNHNILINPSFTVKQRGGVIDHNNTTFGPDRWKFRGVTDVGGTMSQSTSSPASGTNKLVVKHRNATDFSWTYQSIETVNLLGMNGKEMTFSFSYSDQGGSGIPTATVFSWDSSTTSKTLYRAIPTSLGDNRWACTFTLSTEDGTLPILSEKGMQVAIYPNEKNTAPNEWSVWETKLEVGSVATPFIARPFGEEFILCCRYFQRYGSGTGSPLIAVRRGANLIGFNVPYVTKMRTKPSLSFSLPLGAKTTTVRGGGNSETFTDLPDVTTHSDTFVTLSKAGLSFDPSSTEAFVVYQNATGSGGYMFFDSEL